MKNIRNLFNRTAFLLTTAAVMTFASCEKDENISPDDGNGNGNGNGGNNNKIVFVEISKRSISNTSFGTNSKGKTFQGWKSLSDPTFVATVNSPAGEENSVIRTTISMSSRENIDLIATDEKNEAYPPSDLRGLTHIAVNSTRSDSILFDLEGYKNLKMSNIGYEGAYGFVNTITAYDAKIRPGETYYTYFSYRLHLMQQFFKENAQSFSMEVHDKNGFVKDCTNMYISHSTTDPDGNVNKDSLKYARSAVFSFGYFDESRIVFKAQFDAARVDGTTSYIYPSELERYGVKATKNINLLVH